MKYQIDQSGKIEDTAKNTVIAYSNGTQKSILISKKIKRKLQEKFRLCGFSKLFIYYTFAVGIYFLIKDFKSRQSIVVDIEYQKKDKIILQIIKKLLILNSNPSHLISFCRIGNRPRVHYAAHDVFIGKKKADNILNFGEIMKAIKKTDGRLRECFSTLVGVQSRSSKSNISKKLKTVKRKKTK